MLGCYLLVAMVDTRIVDEVDFRMVRVSDDDVVLMRVAR